MATAYDSFSAAEQLEELAACIYRLLARQFAADPAAQGLFSRLEAEEQQHALRIRLLRSQYATAPRTTNTIVLDLDLLEGARREGETLYRLLTAPGREPTLAEARRLAVQLEERFAAAHADTMARNADPALKGFFEALARQDREHAALLRDAKAGG
ncbi:MAG TPA: hypothetical protein VGQ83_05765 [Polyangia bacterium]|jgi:hypothetical protein